MTVQDDAREKETRERFGLLKGGERHEVDAYLDLGILIADPIPFELKSSTKDDSFTTARDAGLEHFQRWREKHWLLVLYDRKPKLTMKTCWYGSPEMMEPKIREFEERVLADHKIGQLVSDSLNSEQVQEMFNGRTEFAIKEALNFVRPQRGSYGATVFGEKHVRDMASLNGGRLNLNQMTEIMKIRSDYLIRRGSTINNPVIAYSWIQENLCELEPGDAEGLRELVLKVLEGQPVKPSKPVVPQCRELWDAFR